MKVLLLARLCAGESYDAHKIANHVNAGSGKTYYHSLGFEYNRVAYTPDFPALSPLTVEILEKYGQGKDTIIFDSPVTDFGIFRNLATIIRNRYPDELEVIILADHPLKFFNDFCISPEIECSRRQYGEIFFTRELYRIDKLIDLAYRVSGGNVRVVASNNAFENERAILELAGLSWDPALESLPHPQTSAGKEVSRLLSLPKMDEMFSLAEWRSISMHFDGEPTSTAPTGMLKKLDELVGKHWRYVKRRYPILEKALDFDTASIIEAPEYIEPDFKKLAAMLPENFAEHFGYLRNGFYPFQNKLFNEFKHLEPASSNPKCTVITFAFNQEKYIGECIESVAAQDAGCEIEHVIFDDASTDRTPEIIRGYAEKYPHIKAVLFSNKPPTTIGMAFQSCRSQYVAICDGDDYYSDPLKLKKQIAFLDTHPEFALCFHYTDVFFDDGRETYTYPPRGAFEIKPAYTLKDLLQGNPMQASSVMYRWRFRNGLPVWFNPFLRPSDWYWHILHAETGPAGFIPEVMSRYRRHSDACYAGADNADSNRHRLLHGLRELEVYDVLDRHLNHEFHDDFSMLTTGVFAELFRPIMANGDSLYVDKASTLFPVFAKDFLSNLKVVRGKKPDDLK